MVVNNAGMLMSGVAEAFTPEQFLKILDTNAVSWLRMARAVLPVMRRQGAGTLVYVSSTTAHIVEPFMATYIASKAAGEAFAESIGFEVTQFGIDTVIVVPGAFTQGTQHFVHTTGPAEPAVTAQYGNLPTVVAQIPQRLAAIDVAQQGHNADVGSVGDALVEVLDRPRGSRPRRVIVDAQRKGVDDVDAIRTERQRTFFTALGIDYLLDLPDRPSHHDQAIGDTTQMETHVPDALHQLVDKFYRAFSGDTDLLDEVVTPDWEDIPLSPGQGPGPDGIKPMINGIGQSFSDFHIVVHDVINGRGEDGNGSIGVRAEMRGTHTGDIFGIPSTGRSVRIPIHEFHVVQDGRLARTWHLEDWFGFFNQIGQSPLIGQDNQ